MRFLFDSILSQEIVYLVSYVDFLLTEFVM